MAGLDTDVATWRVYPVSAMARAWPCSRFWAKVKGCTWQLLVVMMIYYNSTR